MSIIIGTVLVTISTIFFNAVILNNNNSPTEKTACILGVSIGASIVGGIWLIL
jgi:hypothetical protein